MLQVLKVKTGWGLGGLSGVARNAGKLGFLIAPVGPGEDEQIYKDSLLGRLSCCYLSSIS